MPGLPMLLEKKKKLVVKVNSKKSKVNLCINCLMILELKIVVDFMKDFQNI